MHRQYLFSTTTPKAFLFTLYLVSFTRNRRGPKFHSPRYLPSRIVLTVWYFLRSIHITVSTHSIIIEEVDIRSYGRCVVGEFCGEENEVMSQCFRGGTMINFFTYRTNLCFHHSGGRNSFKVNIVLLENEDPQIKWCSSW